MSAAERRRTIIDIVHTQGVVTVFELVGRVGQSEATIRRDLHKLDEQGLLRRTHGGARLINPREGAYVDVVDQRHEAKEAIAQAAVVEVADGQSVLLDIGTTVSRVARHLRGRSITVITRNLAVYAELMEDDAVDLVLLGGVVRPYQRSLAGYLTEESLRQVRADVLLMGTSAVSRSGYVVDTEGTEVSLKRAMMAAADRVVLLADSSKFPGPGTARVCGPAALARVITDRQPPERIAAALTAAGVDILVADPSASVPAGQPTT